jgi:flagella basal body P-ring formation protein FlgA
VELQRVVDHGFHGFTSLCVRFPWPPTPPDFVGTGDFAAFVPWILEPQYAAEWAEQRLKSRPFQPRRQTGAAKIAESARLHRHAGDANSAGKQRLFRLTAGRRLWSNAGMPTSFGTRLNDRLAQLCACLLAALALAQPALARQDPQAVREVVARYLDDQARGLPGAVRITVGEVDAQNMLPPCAALAPFLPAGTRPWGRISVGVQCREAASWTIYVPARVEVVAEYLVTARGLRQGQIVGPADLERASGDLAALPDSVLSDPAQAVGHSMRYAVAGGQPLRAEMLRLPPAVKQGQLVKVIFAGAGFSVSNEGVALNDAGEGGTTRVRLSGGKVVSGVARPGGRVEVGP